MRTASRTLVSLVLAALASPASAEVLIADSSLPLPNTHPEYNQIFMALAAAQDGDTILVRPGTYLPFTITDKAVTVVAEGNAVVQANGLYTPAVRIQMLAAGKQVVVRGLRGVYGVSVIGCAGAVWIDGFQNTDAIGNCFGGVLAGAHVETSARVTFTRCSLVGESGDFVTGFSNGQGSPGVRAIGSTLSLLDCQIRGGRGVNYDSAPWGGEPVPGAAGLLLTGSTVTITGCAIAGGGGGVAQDVCGGVHPPGGAGVAFTGAASTLRSADSTAVGGVTSLEPLCPGQSGPAGPAISGSGTIVPLPGFARHLQANAPVRGGEVLTLAVGGQPGDLPLVVVSSGHEPIPFANGGALLVAMPPEELFLLPTLDASGTSGVAFPVPDVGALVGAATFYAQAVFLDTASTVWLGAGTTIVLVAAGI